MMNNRVPKQSGFTLIELMIVIAIIGVIAAIAMPSYNSYLLKSRRAEAKIALTKMADAQERWYLQKSTYITDVSKIGGADSDPDPLVNGNYTLSAAASADGILNGFVLTAVADADGRQVGDDACKTFTLSSTSAKSAKTSGNVVNTKCW